MKYKSSFLICLIIANTTAISQADLSLKDAVLQQRGKYYPARTLRVNWIPETRTYSYLSSDLQTLKMGNIKKSFSTDLITTADLAKMTGENFPYVNVLEWRDKNNFYTTIGGKYFLISTALKTSKALGVLPKNAENPNLCSANNHVAYTVDNNLFIQTKENKTLRLTDFGPEIVSGQGIARNEFGISGGIFWSNSGEHIGFYQKDESEVADYPLLDITTPTGSLNLIKYPMAGQKSEKSAVGIYDLKTGEAVYIRPQGEAEDYLTNFGWGPLDKFVYLAEVNRDQNHMKLQKFNAETGEFVETIFEEKNDKWVEPEHAPYFVNRTQFVWISERDGFMNLYLYGVVGSVMKQLTTNKWVAHEIIGHNENLVYFEGTGESPLETNYFSVDITTGEQTTLTRGGRHQVSFSSDFNYMFDAMNNRNIPNVEKIYSNKGKEVREVFRAENPYKQTKIGISEYGSIQAGDGRTNLYYRMIKPADFDANKKYPVLVYVYGGPHAQLVTNGFMGGASLWMHWMANQGYIVYTLDGRGSANRGFEFESVIHRQLGKVEMEDQLKGVEYLKSLSYVDQNRLAIHGWSFGGFMTTTLMLRAPGVFRVGVAGGPVTDWSFYEVMYGERYMDRPSQNVEGYADNRLANYAEKLKGQLLLIHGTADDVVVMQHNLALVQAFVEAGVQMDFFPYPMHKHNVRGKDRVHLIEKVLTYIIDNNKG